VAAAQACLAGRAHAYGDGDGVGVGVGDGATVEGAGRAGLQPVQD
jgi:hypothetical protein